MKLIKGAFAGLAFAGVILGLVIRELGMLPAAQASEVCTNATIRGTYSWQTSGLIIPNQKGFPPGPLVELGFLSFDGNGNVSGTTTANHNGQVAQATFPTGSVVVNPDCTGFLTLKDPSGGAFILKLAIVKGGQEVLFVITSPSEILDSGTLKKLGSAESRNY